MENSAAEPQGLGYEGKRTQRLARECLDILSLCRDHDGQVRSDPRCRNPECRWLNEDGTKGCNDKKALHFDHILGGGSIERSEGKRKGNTIYYEIKRCPWRFQLLCANCNEIKSKGEKRGARRYEKSSVPELELREQQLKEERELLEAEWSFLTSRKTAQ
jgi:hypothetical protein